MVPGGNQTVYVLTAPVVRDHGADVEDWDGDVVRVRVDGCAVEPLQAREILANRDASQAAWRVRMPMQDADGDDVEVGARSQVEFAGVPHAIIGEPLRHTSPSGNLDHIELLCESWTG